jgi:hypothetical protein
MPSKPTRAVLCLVLAALPAAALASPLRTAANPKAAAAFSGKLTGSNAYKGTISFRTSADRKKVVKLTVRGIAGLDCKSGQIYAFSSAMQAVYAKPLPVKSGRFSLQSGGWHLAGAFTSSTISTGTVTLDSKVLHLPFPGCSTGKLTWSALAK